MKDFYDESITKIGDIKLKTTLKTNSKVVLLGSCFSSNLEFFLSNIYLNSIASPFGNIYNPKSISSSLNRLISGKLISENELINIDGLYQHFDFYSKYGDPDRNSFIDNINKRIQKGHEFILDSDIVILTLGTSFVFEKDGQVVNNCHKLPRSSFSRRALNLNEIIDSLSNSISSLLSINPKVKVILSLSPVRHLRDSFTENSYSKALLRVAIEELTKKERVEYFPSYEILLDELRDYRWYSSDLTHPSERAVNYIMDKFLHSTGDNRLLEYYKEIESLNKMLNHKIINPESRSSLDFIKNRELKINRIVLNYPEIEGLKEIR